MANNISIGGQILGAGGNTAFGATAQSSFPSTTITTVSSTSLTTLDLTKINALIGRVEEMRVYLAQTRTDLINAGIQKGSA